MPAAAADLVSGGADHDAAGDVDGSDTGATSAISRAVDTLAHPDAGVAVRDGLRSIVAALTTAGEDDRLQRDLSARLEAFARVVGVASTRLALGVTAPRAGEGEGRTGRAAAAGQGAHAAAPGSQALRAAQASRAPLTPASLAQPAANALLAAACLLSGGWSEPVAVVLPEDVDAAAALAAAAVGAPERVRPDSHDRGGDTGAADAAGPGSSGADAAADDAAKVREGCLEEARSMFLAAGRVCRDVRRCGVLVLLEIATLGPAPPVQPSAPRAAVLAHQAGVRARKVAAAALSEVVADVAKRGEDRWGWYAEPAERAALKANFDSSAMRVIPRSSAGGSAVVNVGAVAAAAAGMWLAQTGSSSSGSSGLTGAATTAGSLLEWRSLVWLALVGAAAAMLVKVLLSVVFARPHSGATGRLCVNIVVSGDVDGGAGADARKELPKPPSLRHRLAAVSAAAATPRPGVSAGGADVDADELLRGVPAYMELKDTGALTADLDDDGDDSDGGAGESKSGADAAPTSTRQVHVVPGAGAVSDVAIAGLRQLGLDLATPAPGASSEGGGGALPAVGSDHGAAAGGPAPAEVPVPEDLVDTMEKLHAMVTESGDEETARRVKENLEFARRMYRGGGGDAGDGDPDGVD